MTNRTVQKHWRAYVDGYDLSGYTRSIGSLNWAYGEADGVTLTDAITGAYHGQASIGTGSLNAMFDNSTDGPHDALKGEGIRDVMYPAGIAAAPTSGDPVFCAQILQTSYMGEANDGNSLATATLDFGMWDRRADTLAYGIPWGHLIHPKGAETSANSSTSDYDHGSQTTSGGFMMYQVFSSDGTVAVKVQDASTDSDVSFSDLASSGDVDASSTPKSGVVALATGATVDRYLRWQIALNTATTVTFALAFVRGY